MLRFRFITSIVLSLFLVLSGFVFSQPNNKAIGVHTLDDLRGNFLFPGKEYGSAPLWVWHTKVTKSIIDSMMLEFKENSFGGVMVHPRPGLITEYLSPEWHNLYQYTIQRGKALGLDVWIYDENSYPSGMAGGLVADEMPESYNQGQMLHLFKYETLPDSLNDIFIALKSDKGTFMDISNKLKQEKGNKGNYYLFNKEYYKKQAGTVGPPEFPYVDLMVSGATEKFLELTMQGYEKFAGKEFGSTVPGLFSDEPNIMTQGAGNIRWTPDLFSTFRKRWGYDLKIHLPSLFEETGDWKRVRHNYWQTLLQLFIDRWSKPMYEYMEKHKLKWTGHYWEHEWPNPGLVPDNMAMYAWHQLPGIDMLFNRFNEQSPHAQFGNIRSVKELSSVANQLGKHRTLSETYGGGGWELTFKDMKRLADWQYVMGVNFLNQHLSMMTLTGARKYDYPQSFSYHTPWWSHYKSLNEYCTRISYVLSQGRQQNEILIIEPTTSAWMYVAPGKNYPELTNIGNDFQKFITTLEKAQVEYDLGSEYIIQLHGKTMGKSFVVGDRAYHTVVVPPGMENIDRTTYDLLKAYTNAGGKLILFDSLQRIDGALGKDLRYLKGAEGAILHFENLTQDIIKEQFDSEGFQISPDNNTTIGGNLYHHRRQLKDGQIIFLANSSMDAAAKGLVTVKGKDAVLLDANTGQIFDYPEQQQPGGISLPFNLAPAGSILFFVAKQKQTGFEHYKVHSNPTVIKGTEMQVIRPSENTLMIDFCEVQFADTILSDVHVNAASNVIFKHYGFNRNPWNHQVQFRDNFVSRDTFSAGTGFTASYYFNIANAVIFDKFRAVVEQGSLWNEIKVNGQLVKPMTGSWWMDRSYGVLSIGEFLKPGINSLSVTINPMSVYAEIGPLYILGDFNLESAHKGWQIVPPTLLKQGSWKSQGLPMYPFGIRYVKYFNLNEPGKRYELQLESWKGTVAAVKVNGRSAGIVYSEPNTVDITNHLRSGSNYVEVEVIGSLKNLLGPHYNNPEPGIVSPGHWTNIKTYPPGEKYDTYEYGLLGSFHLLSYGE